MNTLIKRLLLFFLIAFLFLLLLSRIDNIDKKLSQDNNIVSIKNKSKFDSLDILFVGNSYCYSGIIPEIFDSINYKTYNLGISTAGPYFYELLLDEYLAQCQQKPKSIYLLISPTTFSCLADNFLAYPIHRYLENSFTNEYIAYKYKEYNEYDEILQKSIRKGFSNIFTVGMKKNENFETLLSKGYCKSTQVYTSNILKSTQALYYPLRKDNFSEIKFKHLLNYLENLNKIRNIEIVLFDLPTNELKNYYNSNFISNYNVGKSILSKKYKFISLDSSLPNSCFQNIDHLNYSGAQIVTNNLVRIILSKKE